MADEDAGFQAEEEEELEIPLIDQLSALLDKGFSEQAVELVKEPEHKVEILQDAWDLVPKVCGYLTQQTLNSRMHVIEDCQEILRYMVEICSAKELLLALLEQVSDGCDVVRYDVLLQALQDCLQKLPTKRYHSLVISLETLTAFFAHMSLPDEQNLELQEKLLLTCDEKVRQINRATEAYTKFLKPFVLEVSWKTLDASQKQKSGKQITDLTKTIIKIFDQPLGYVDISIIKERPNMQQGMRKNKAISEPPQVKKEFKSESREIAEKLMDLLNLLICNYPATIMKLLEENQLIDKKNKEIEKKKGDASADLDDEDFSDTLSTEEPVPMLGICVLCYLVFGEKLHDESLPLVHSPAYLLGFNLPFINYLLHRPESLVVFKGLSLSESLLSRVPDLNLDGNLLESAPVKEVINSLIHVMTTSKVKELNQFAVVLLRLLLNKFKLQGRNKMLYSLLNTTSHVGVVGYVITMLKDEIDANLKCGLPDQSFTGNALHKHYNLIFSLPSGATTDLLEQIERIMGALNLLRYLVLRDRPQINITGIWSQMSKIQSAYCETLRTGIKMSRAHYQMELENVKKGSGKCTELSDVNFSVSGIEMPQLSVEQQMEVFTKALHSFDMMESILSRVNEVIDQQRKEHGEEN